MPAAIREFVSQAGCPARRSVIDDVYVAAGLYRYPFAGIDYFTEMRRFEMSVHDDHIRTANVGQTAQYPFEVATKRIGRDWRGSSKCPADERHAVPDRRRNPHFDPYRGESIGRTSGGSFGNNDVSTESEMRPMRFDGSDRQQDDRVDADLIGNFGPAQER